MSGCLIANFFRNTHNICYFLKSQNWEEDTNQTINKLSDTSSQTVEKLKQSEVIQKQTAERQRQRLNIIHSWPSSQQIQCIND